MAWIIFAVIAGLSAFQFYQARVFYAEGMSLDCAFRVVVGAFFTVLAMVFGLGALLA